jgi:hypothetical protein
MEAISGAIIVFGSAEHAKKQASKKYKASGYLFNWPHTSFPNT